MLPPAGDTPVLEDFLAGLHGEDSPFDKYTYLTRMLLPRQPDLFFRLLASRTEDVLPYVYTPTVAEAAQRWSEVTQGKGKDDVGMVAVGEDKEGMLERFREWKSQDVKVVIVTDGERILGLGDLGINGMPVMEGKSFLYSGLGGVSPSQVLPICLDVGTDNPTLRDDPSYAGLKGPRLRGEQYDAFVEDFVTAVKEWQPEMVMHFEDFANENAFKMLDRYKDRVCCFNDDIQCGGAIVLAGLKSAMRVTKSSLPEQRILFFGAGEAAAAIAETIVQALVSQNGLDPVDARRVCYMFDTHGLVTHARLESEPDLLAHKRPYAHDVATLATDLLSAVRAVRPTVLIGTSGKTGAFSKEVFDEMLGITPRPIVFALSAPTELEEVSFRKAYEWTDGRVVYASGSPSLPELADDGTIKCPTFLNDCYLFPFIGAAALFSKARLLPQEAFVLGSQVLAEHVAEEDLAAGMLLPPLSTLNELAVPLIASIAEFLAGMGASDVDNKDREEERSLQDWTEFVRQRMWQPPTIPSKMEQRQEKGAEGAPEAAVVAVPEAKTKEEKEFWERVQAEMNGLRKMITPIQKFLYLRNLQASSRRVYGCACVCVCMSNVQLSTFVQTVESEVFFALLRLHAEELLPFVYTPTVGEVCQRYSELRLRTTGVFLTITRDKGHVLNRLRASRPPNAAVRVIVVTDGERILGLGDLGANGMGISEGKILLYTVLAGVPPEWCLPVCIDVGTNNRSLLEDESYIGIKQERVRGEEYDAFVEEFISALKEWQPHMLLQFEDFGNVNAFRLLERYRPRLCCFNDDIQGTACIVVAGVLSALRVQGVASLQQQKFLFLGAGEAGTGIAHLLALALRDRAGVDEADALARCFFLDSKGLINKARANEEGDHMQAHKLPFAHDVPFEKDLLSAVKSLKPTALIGVSAQPRAFTKEVVQAMAAINERPIIFPLSNPTSKSECTFEEAFEWTNGKVVFASGSPFPPLIKDGKTYYPAQANNAYIFPGIGHAAVLTRCMQITDEVFLNAAEALAELTPEADLERGKLFPPFSDIQRVSEEVIARTADFIVDAGLGYRPDDADVRSREDWLAYAKAHFYVPKPHIASAGQRVQSQLTAASR
eukprot:jgi/Chlat1/3774/Chrsp259S00288